MEMYNRVWPLIEAGKLKPIIHTVVRIDIVEDNIQLPLEEVVKAHTMMEKNEQIGKIVLTME